MKTDVLALAYFTRDIQELVEDLDGCGPQQLLFQQAFRELLALGSRLDTGQEFNWKIFGDVPAMLLTPAAWSRKYSQLSWEHRSTPEASYLGKLANWFLRAAADLQDETTSLTGGNSVTHGDIDDIGA